MRCGDCKACKAVDCGKCFACKDKPKFGGTNRLKQTCVKRKCPYLRFAPPAKETPKKLSKEEHNELKLQFARGSKKRTREDTVGDDLCEAKFTAAKDGGSNRKRGRPRKHRNDVIIDELTVEEPTKTEDEQPHNQATSAVSSAVAIQPSKTPVERNTDPDDHMLALISFIKSRPLSGDHNAKKIRQIIIKALKNPDNSKTQDLACEDLRKLANDQDHVTMIIYLGGLRMVSKAMKDHPDKTIVQAEASAFLAQLAWVDPSCVAAIIAEGLHHLVLSSMHRHTSHLKVQQMGCGFFRAISYEFANHQCIENVNGVGEIIDAMSRNSKKQLVMKEGCFFLQNMLCNPDILPETIRLVVSSNIALTIVDELSENMNDPDFVDAACGFLSNLVINDDARSHVGEYQKSIPTLLSILGCDITVDAVKRSMNALRLLATGSDVNVAKIVNNGGIQKVIDVLQTCHDAELSHLCLRLLADLSRNDTDIGNRLADSGCMRVVSNQMRKHSDYPFIQATCCGILRTFPTLDAEQAKSVTELTVAAMKKNRDDKSVQFEGCHALLRHCVDFTSVSGCLQSNKRFKAKSNMRPTRRQRRKPNAREGPPQVTKMANEPYGDEQTNTTVEFDIESIINIKPLKDDQIGKKIRQIIIKALQNPDNSKTQDLACEALRKLANDQYHVSKIVYFGGLKMVSKAMKDHPDKTIVQAEASAFLAQLAWVDPSCVAAIIAEGLHHLVLSSMHRHTSHLKVQQMGCGFFRAISYEFANHQCIENVNGVGEIIDAMSRNSKKQLVMKEGCFFLQNMLCNPDILPETIRLVVSSNIALTIVDELSENMNDPDFVDAACGFLSNLVINDDARSHVGEYQKSIPTLLSMLERDIIVDACKNAMNALRHLASRNDVNVAKIVDNGGIQKVIDYLKRQNNDVIVVDAGLGLLSELAQDVEISQRLLDSGCVDLIKKETKKHSDSPHIQARACEMLPNLLIDGNDIKGAIGFTLTAMKNHKHSLVQYAGCHALLQYCCRFPESIQLLQSKRAMPILRESQYTPWNDTTNS